MGARCGGWQKSWRVGGRLAVSPPYIFRRKSYFLSTPFPRGQTYLWAVRLRSVELRGFKSFAEAVRLPLSARLIGIVGPNGCGKSNIADALRWIMGEQKGRLLRIEKADNLIFNGTQRRKPLPFAEVTLEVEDFSPELPRLAFTRRAHRSGESEYFLNGTPARLKDFLTYFWQVGLTPQGILDGGQVEALIHDRGGARRALIETLAGIERYHHHKKEVLAELEKTQQALSHLNAVLAQLHEQKAQLETQAQKVAAYREVKGAYRQLLLQWISRELSQIAKARQQYQEQFETHQRESEAISESLVLLERRILALEERLQAKEIQEIEAVYEALRFRQQELLREESTLLERKKHIERQTQEIAEELAYRSRQKEELTAEEEKLREKRQQQETAFSQAQQVLARLQEKQGQLLSTLQQAEAQFRQAEQQNTQQENLLREVERRWQSLHARMAPLQERIQAVRQEMEAQRHHLQDLLERKQVAETRLQVLRQQQQEIHRLLSALHAQQKALNSQRERLLAQSRRLQASLQRVISQRETLEALLAQVEGWPAFLADLRRQGEVAFWRTEDIFFAEETDLPVLSLLLRLEPPTLWVRSVEEAQRLHAHILRQQEGFFCVRVYSGGRVKEGGWTQRLQTLEGFEGLAEYLWGDVSVRREETEEILDESKSSGLEVSADGRWGRWDKGWVYQLSPFQTAHIGLPHRIQRLRQAEELWQKRQEVVQTTLATVEKALSRLPLPHWQQHKREVETQLAQVEKEVAALIARQEEACRREEMLTQESERLQSQLDALEKEVAEVEPLREQGTADLERKKAAVDQARLEVEELRREQEALQKQVSEQRIRTVQIENDLKSSDRSYKMIVQQLEEVRKRLLYLTERQREANIQAAQLEERLQELGQEKSALEPQMREALSRLEQLRAERKAVEEQVSDLRRQFWEKQKVRESLQGAFTRLASRRAEVDQKEALLRQRLAVEAEASEEELSSVPPLRLKADEVEKELALLKEKLTHFGQLNFEAAEALEALLQREQSLQQEKVDIEAVLNQLRQLVHSLDIEARERFLQAFERVRERFIQLFQGLFAEGDTCDLVLVRPEEPLASEIEIIARPKGKRPLSLQQLSGGEKALTALALLFATFAVRPSAICVLDEVDAPLDDANAHKLGRLLRRFAEETPLIVITHNKITMSYCEVLYGVTMPEPGVSTVLAVELAQVEAVGTAA